MKDIVIPYRKNGSGELEACIALIKKNVPHRNIYVVEDYDKSLDKGISHINQILKLKWALENLDLTEEFYLFNDDFFILEPIDEIPYYHKGTLDEHINSRSGNDHYTRALKATRKWLGGDALSYEVHVPFLFNRDLLSWEIRKLHSYMESGTCPLIRSWYGNSQAVGGTRISDVKNIPISEVGKYLSTTEQSFYRRYKDYIRSKI